MCTLALAWNVFTDAPVAAAANRDETLDRPAEPPSLRSSDAPSVLAPRDARAGGTWIGLNDRGLYVTVTNRWLDEHPPADRSRGLLVADCLRAPSAEDAVGWVERELDERSYAGFNLVVADDDAAFLLSWDGRLRIHQFTPGVSVVVNVGVAGADAERFALPESDPERTDRAERQAHNARRLRDRLQPEPGEACAEWLARAGRTLGDHDAGVCVHGDGFGTRSSSLVRTGADPAFRYADGPPCETPYEPVPVPDEWPVSS